MKFDFPEHWQLLPLESVMEAIIDYRGKTPKKTDFGIPLVTAKIIKDGRILEPAEFIAEEEYDSWMVRGLPEVGDVVITSEAPLGEVAQLTNSNIALAQRVVTLRGKKGILNNDFLLCAIQSRYVQYQLESRASGSTVKGIKQSELRKVLLPIPPEKEQIQIAHYIKTLSNKIDLNRQTNQTLEQIAQAIFKSWFVDFEPTRAKVIAKQKGGGEETQSLAAQAILCGAITLEDIDALSNEPSSLQLILNNLINSKLIAQNHDKPSHNWLPQQLIETARFFPNTLADSEFGDIPDGWGIQALGQYIEIKRGGSPRPIKDYIVKNGLPWTKIADATAELSPFLFRTKEYIREEGLKKTVLLKKGTLILSNSATPGLPKFLELDACIHDGWLHFPKKKLFTDIYLYHLFLEIRKALVAQGNGSVFTNLKTDILRSHLVLIPSQALIDTFDKAVTLLFSMVKENCKEINTLNEIKDSLLPKLLSGKLSVGTEQLDELQNDRVSA